MFFLRIPHTDRIYLLPQSKLMLARNLQIHTLVHLGHPLPLGPHPLTLIKIPHAHQSLPSLHNRLILLHLNILNPFLR